MMNSTYLTPLFPNNETLSTLATSVVNDYNPPPPTTGSDSGGGAVSGATIDGVQAEVMAACGITSLEELTDQHMLDQACQLTLSTIKVSVLLPVVKEIECRFLFDKYRK